MMRALRMVGGPEDGRRIAFYGGSVRLVKRIGSVFDGPDDATPEVEFLDYTVRKVHMPSGEAIEFLAPSDWTDEQALRHALS